MAFKVKPDILYKPDPTLFIFFGYINIKATTNFWV